MLDVYGIFNVSNCPQVNLTDIILIAAMGPPGGGRNPITPRFLRHFNTFTINEFESDTMKLIFSRIMDWHLSKSFSAEMKSLGTQVSIPPPRGNDKRCVLFTISQKNAKVIYS